jgi:hypothetical protein
VGAATKRLKSQVSSLDRQLKDAQKKAKSELNKQVAATTKRLQADFDRKLREAQRTAKRELDKQVASATKDLRTQLDRAKREATNAAKTIVANAEWQKTLIASMQDMPLADLMNCLQGQALAGGLDFGPAVQQFADDPVKFVQKVAQETAYKGAKEFGALIASEIKMISETGELPNDRELVTRAMDKIALVIADNGAAQCVFNEVRPHLERASREIISFARETAMQMQAEAQRTLEEEILPALMKPASDKLKEILTKQVACLDQQAYEEACEVLPKEISVLLLTPAEAKAIARDVLYRRNIKERFRMAEVSLDKLLDPGTAASQVQTHVADLQKLVQGTQDFEALYAELAIESIRAVGHKYMNSPATGHGAWLLLYAMAILQDAQDAVVNVVDGVCGLIPEAGAAVAAVIMYCIDLIWNPIAIPALESFAHDQMHGAVDLLADKALEMIEDGKNMEQITQAMDQLGPLAVVLRNIPHEQLIGIWADAIMKEELEMLERHFGQVQKLAAKTAAK